VAELVVADDYLLVRLTAGEKFWGFHGNIRVPLSGIFRVKALDNAWIEMRGWRMAGVGLPGKLALGTRRHGEGYDFVAVHGQRHAVQIDVNGPPRWQRIVVTVEEGEDAAHEAGRIAEAAGITAS
jgi:hypothetical protein